MNAQLAIRSTPAASIFDGIPGIEGGQWNPDRSGSYDADCAFGRRAAREIVDAIESSGNPTLLASIARLVVESGSWGGVEIGLFTGLGMVLS